MPLTPESRLVVLQQNAAKARLAKRAKSAGLFTRHLQWAERGAAIRLQEIYEELQRLEIFLRDGATES